MSSISKRPYCRWGLAVISQESKERVGRVGCSVILESHDE
jgi:hypothetical protein